MLNNGFTSEFIRSFFVFALGIGTTWLTLYYKNRRNIAKVTTPADRERFLFDRYERALSQVDDDLEVARQINKEQLDINQQQSAQIEKMQGTIDTLRGELAQAQKVNHSLLLANIKLVKQVKPVEEIA